MKIIDFARRGNIVRFYLASNDLEDWHGDDWDDYPYEHNAGPVYSRYVSGYRDVAFPFDTLVLEPACGSLNSEWCKDDMKRRLVPCLIVVPLEEWRESWFEDFAHFICRDGAMKYYFGDQMDPDVVGLPPDMAEPDQFHP